MCIRKLVISALLMTQFVQAQSIENKTILNENNKIVKNITKSDARFDKVSLISSSDKGYSNFFELNDRDIKVSVVGSSESPLTIKGKISYFNAKIHKTEIDKLTKFFNALNIKQEGIEEITHQLVHGITSSKQCKGNKSTCLVIDSEFNAVVDFYNNSLRLFIPNKWFGTSDKTILLEPISENLLVSRLYGNVSYTTDYQYFLRSENLFGIGDGYVKYDFIKNDLSSDISQLNYNYDTSEYSLTGGLITNTQRLGIAGQNSLINDRFFGIDLSNQKLLEVKNFSARKVEFFSPSDGVLSVYKSDGELIYQSNIQSGKNSIDYSLLPYGNYAINYEVDKNETIVFKSEGFVSNSDAFDASSFSAYTRLGIKEQRNESNNNLLIFDTGFSVPLLNQHSMIGSASFIEDEWFAGLGYYANINNHRLSMKYSLGESTHRINADLYSPLFNLSISDTKSIKNNKSFLGEGDHLIVSGGIHKNYGLLNLGINANYNETEYDNYLSYNINSSYSFGYGTSLYVSYSAGDYQDMLSISLSMPLSSQSNYSAILTDNNGTMELSNQITGHKTVNDQITVNTSASHRYKEGNENNIDAYISSNYNSDTMTGSLGLRRQTTGDIAYNGSFSTTAYVTQNKVYFKDALSTNSSAIEVVAMNNTLQGKVKLHDKVSGRKNTEAMSGSTLLDMKPYSQVVVDYEFDNDEFALTDIDLDRNASVNLLPGKIHYIQVSQQPIGNILIVMNNSNSEEITCTGPACIDQKSINAKVLKFRVKPEQSFSIHRNGEFCFEGQVTQGQTDIGICQ